MLVPKFVLIGRHHYNGEKEILEEQPINRSLIRLKKKQWLEVIIPIYLFCCVRMLYLELKGMTVPAFHQHLLLDTMHTLAHISRCIHFLYTRIHAYHYPKTLLLSWPNYPRTMHLNLPKPSLFPICDPLGRIHHKGNTSYVQLDKTYRKSQENGALKFLLWFAYVLEALETTIVFLDYVPEAGRRIPNWMAKG